MLTKIKDLMSDVGRDRGFFTEKRGRPILEKNAYNRFAAPPIKLAKRVGVGTVDFARKVGPVRGLIGLALLGVAIGGSVALIRRLRDRDMEDETIGEGGDVDSSTVVQHRRRRAANRHAQVSH